MVKYHMPCTGLSRDQLLINNNLTDRRFSFFPLYLSGMKNSFELLIYASKFVLKQLVKLKFGVRP